jgi:hypothetical protein
LRAAASFDMSDDQIGWRNGSSTRPKREVGPQWRIFATSRGAQV